MKQNVFSHTSLKIHLISNGNDTFNMVWTEIQD